MLICLTESKIETQYSSARTFSAQPGRCSTLTIVTIIIIITITIIIITITIIITTITIIIITSSHHIKIRNPPEQYVGRGNNINFIFMRDLTSPPSLNNMLVGVIASTLSS